MTEGFHAGASSSGFSLGRLREPTSRRRRERAAKAPGYSSRSRRTVGPSSPGWISARRRTSSASWSAPSSVRTTYPVLTASQGDRCCVTVSVNSPRGAPLLGKSSWGALCHLVARQAFLAKGPRVRYPNRRGLRSGCCQVSPTVGVARGRQPRACGGGPDRKAPYTHPER
jgi:hypothetical protein